MVVESDRLEVALACPVVQTTYPGERNSGTKGVI